MIIKCLSRCLISPIIKLSWLKSNTQTASILWRFSVWNSDTGDVASWVHLLLYPYPLSHLLNIIAKIRQWANLFIYWTITMFLLILSPNSRYALCFFEASKALCNNILPVKISVGFFFSFEETEKVVLKLTWKCKVWRILKAILKNKVGRLSLSDTRTWYSYKAIIMRTVWHSRMEDKPF